MNGSHTSLEMTYKYESREQKDALMVYGAAKKG